MIIDTLKNCQCYYGVNAKFEKAFGFIKNAVKESLPVGKYEIDGTEIYAMIQEYETKLPDESRFEAHKNYIDIQYIISGIEKMEITDISKAMPNTEYNAEKDVIFFDDTDTVTAGVFTDEEYAVFFPQDVHKPGMANGVKDTVKKIVVKVKID